MALGGVCVAVVACSDDTRVGFSPEDSGVDASGPITPDGSFAEIDAGGCPPTAPARPIPASAPARFTPGACTTAEVDGYVQDCLGSDGNVCKAFKDANVACAKCIESADTDATWGPIVFYDSRIFYDYNYGGCIANVTDDFATTGCGAAQTRYLACRHAACNACLPPGLPRDFEPFFECQKKKATDTLCAAELTEANTACAAYFASKPTDACQGSTLAPEQYLKQLIGAWCVGSPVDGGADGG
ncbi:MAG: hypothetical protein KF819_12630 [Labilithrix sp.]|nr:hypothetical protein [Labilithrix sp.]